MSGLFGGGGVSQTTPAAAGLQYQTSAYGKPIALIYGTTRVAGNLLWYGDFTAIAHREKVGGKGGSAKTTRYTYTVAAAMAMGEGPIVGIGAIWVGKANKTLAELGLNLYLGDTTQVADSYISTNHPGEAINYRRLAYVLAPVYDLGDSASLENHNFEVQGLLRSSLFFSSPDVNPKDILVDFLTHVTHGAGWSSAKLGDWTAWSNYCLASGLRLSPAYDDQSPAAETVKRLADITNTAPVWSDGVLKMLPYGDAVATGTGYDAGVTYTPDNTVQYELTDDDFLDDDQPVKVTRSGDIHNHFQIKFKNRFKAYATDLAEDKDQASIEAMGLRTADPLDYPEICDGSVAQTVVTLIKQRRLYLRNTYAFRLSARFMRLEPMDIVTLTESTGSGLTGVPVRITEVDEGDDNSLSIKAEDFPGTIGSHVAYPRQDAGGYTTDYNAPVGNCQSPVFLEPPVERTTTGLAVWCAVTGQAGDALWGGANLWVSADGASYRMVGTSESRSRYGHLTADLAQAGTSLSLAMDGLGGVISPGSGIAADVMETLLYIGGAVPEYLAYQGAALTGANAYTLSGLVRGAYRTVDAGHALNDPVVRVDESLLKGEDLDLAMIGKTLYFKVQGFNIYGGGLQDISTLPAYSYTVTGFMANRPPSTVASMQAEPQIDGVLLSWPAVTDPNLAEYEVRLGATWATAAYIGKSRTTYLKVPPASVGSVFWLIKAISNTGIYSTTATTATLTVVAPTAPTVTQQVIDNNVLLYWSPAASTQAIQTYEIRRGATWATATVIGQKSGLFTSVFETTAGTYTYWVAAIDIAGNVGTPGGVTTTVNAPPDYVLKANIDSIFNGAFSNALLEQGRVVMPVDIAATYADHFTGNGWATPQDQVTAGFPIFIEPSTASGSYTEFIDYGTTLAACKITASFAGTVVAGAPVVSCDILVSADNVSYTTYAGVTETYATAFRYVKVRINVASTGGDDLYTLDMLNTRLDVKLKNDAGSMVWNGNPAAVSFNLPFIDVQSINLTPMGTTASLTAVTDFVDTPNPTTFQVYLFNSATGIAPSGPITVAWAVKGY